MTARDMTSGARLEAIFRGEMVDRIPFALKGWRVAPCQAERELRNRGMGIFDSAAVYRTRSPNVQSTAFHFTDEAGVRLVRTVTQTPAGELTSVSRPLGSVRGDSTSWTVEHMFKGPADYARLRALVEDRRYEPCYEVFEIARARAGADAFFKTGAPGCPLHTVLYTFMGPEVFAIEWAERRDEILALCAAMTANEEPIYEIVARSPALPVQCGGNYAPEMLGKQRFLEHVVPHWEAAAAVLHAGGKMLGCHLDANNRLWADEVGAAPLDWIEAFTPAPDTDMTFAEARAAWPGMVQFINFPSSVHLQPAPTIQATTRQLVRESAPGDRFVIGITENVPEHRWRESFVAIMDALDECGALPVAT